MTTPPPTNPPLSAGEGREAREWWILSNELHGQGDRILDYKPVAPLFIHVREVLPTPSSLPAPSSQQGTPPAGADAISARLAEAKDGDRPWLERDLILQLGYIRGILWGPGGETRSSRTLNAVAYLDAIITGKFSYLSDGHGDYVVPSTREGVPLGSKYKFGDAFGTQEPPAATKLSPEAKSETPAPRVSESVIEEIKIWRGDTQALVKDYRDNGYEESARYCEIRLEHISELLAALTALATAEKERDNARDTFVEAVGFYDTQEQELISQLRAAESRAMTPAVEALVETAMAWGNEIEWPSLTQSQKEELTRRLLSACRAVEVERANREGDT